MTCIFLAGAFWLYAPAYGFMFRVEDMIAVNKHRDHQVLIHHDGGSVLAPTTAEVILDAIKRCPDGPGITWERAK